MSLHDSINSKWCFSNICSNNKSPTIWRRRAKHTYLHVLDINEWIGVWRYAILNFFFWTIRSSKLFRFNKKRDQIRISSMVREIVPNTIVVNLQCCPINSFFFTFRITCNKWNNYQKKKKKDELIKFVIRSFFYCSTVFNIYPDAFNKEAYCI